MKCTRAQLHPSASLAGAFKLAGLRRRSNEFQIIVRRQRENEKFGRILVDHKFCPILRGFDCLNYFISSITFIPLFHDDPSFIIFNDILFFLLSSYFSASQNLYERKIRSRCYLYTRNEKREHIIVIHYM